MQSIERTKEITLYHRSNWSLKFEYWTIYENCRTKLAEMRISTMMEFFKPSGSDLHSGRILSSRGKSFRPCNIRSSAEVQSWKSTINRFLWFPTNAHWIFEHVILTFFTSPLLCLMFFVIFVDDGISSINR